MSKLSSQEHMQLYPLIKNPKPLWDGALAASSPRGSLGGYNLLTQLLWCTLCFLRITAVGRDKPGLLLLQHFHPWFSYTLWGTISPMQKAICKRPPLPYSSSFPLHTHDKKKICLPATILQKQGLLWSDVPLLWVMLATTLTGWLKRFRTVLVFLMTFFKSYRRVC